MTKTQLKNKELVEKYPFLIPRHLDIFDDWGYEWTCLDDMPQGWRTTFGEQMCEEILRCLKKANFVNEYRVLQVKEKYGGLRWYYASVPELISDEMNDIVTKYEEMSCHICGHCGKSATKISIGWIFPFCDECAAKTTGITFEEMTV